MASVKVTGSADKATVTVKVKGAKTISGKTGAQVRITLPSGKTRTANVAKSKKAVFKKVKLTKTSKVKAKARAWVSKKAEKKYSKWSKTKTGKLTPAAKASSADAPIAAVDTHVHEHTVPVWETVHHEKATKWNLSDSYCYRCGFKFVADGNNDDSSYILSSHIETHIDLGNWGNDVDEVTIPAHDETVFVGYRCSCGDIEKITSKWENSPVQDSGITPD